MPSLTRCAADGRFYVPARTRRGGLPRRRPAVKVPEEEGRFTSRKVRSIARNGRPAQYLQRHTRANRGDVFSTPGTGRIGTRGLVLDVPRDLMPTGRLVFARPRRRSACSPLRVQAMVAAHSLSFALLLSRSCSSASARGNRSSSKRTREVDRSESYLCPIPRPCGIPTAYVGAFPSGGPRDGALPILSRSGSRGGIADESAPASSPRRVRAASCNSCRVTREALAVESADPARASLAGAHYSISLVSRFGGNLGSRSPVPRWADSVRESRPRSLA